MKLAQLFSFIPGIPEDAFSDESEVTGVFNDARQVLPGSVFVAIPGVKVDGHQFIPVAIANGAIALVVQSLESVPTSFSGFVLQNANTRDLLDQIAARFYLYPGQELFCVGVTGTNGKTSVTYMTEAILNAGQISTGVIGTVDHHLGEKVWHSEMTTPDPVFLQKRLREFRAAGAMAVAMEVSSHALDQRRVDSVPFNTVIFTNLTRDHLDYHSSMESYFAAKQRLFTDLLRKSEKRPHFAIINTSDKYGRRLRVADSAELWTYGADDADLRFEVMKMDFTFTHFKVFTPRGEGEVHLPMSGVHNVMNALAALGAGLSAGIPLSLCISALEKFKGVPGRLQAVPNDKGLSIFVDYAHSPDALENVLTALNRVRENLQVPARIWTVFGCGGDRDKGKRPLMAQAALKFSDRVVVTSDNPRTEKPEAIIEEVIAGIATAERSRVDIIVDRSLAIAHTIEKAAKGDVILIAGKGHEDYQILGTEKVPFSDFQVAREALQRR